jgi:phospholipid/cholesterol/gamma-HCH transport system substrate-binding protein
MIDNRTPVFDYTRAEIVAGVFVLIGLAMLGYLSTAIGGLRLRPRDAYHVRARFSNIGDLKARAPVKVAGVTVGRVDSIRLAELVAEVRLGISRTVRLPQDTIASISTAGLLGDAFVSLSPGGSDVNLKDGDSIGQTEPALNMSDLVGKAAFGTTQAPSPNDDQGNKADEPARRKTAPPPQKEELR